MTIQEAFELAAEHHQAGRLREAEMLYRQILAQQPNHAESLHLLGVLAHQIGRSADAVELIKRAIAINPNATFYNNLGIVLCGKDQIDQRVEAYRKACELYPASPELHDNLAAALLELGNGEEAEAEYRKSLTLRPGSADTHNNLGSVLFHLGRFDEAMAELRMALSLRPNFCEAYNNIGNVWQRKGDYEQAILAYRQALALRPDSSDTLYNLGIAQEHRGLLDDSIDSFRKCAALGSDRPDVQYQLGRVLHKCGRIQDAASAYQAAITLKHDHAEAHNAMGILFSELALVDQAMEAYRNAIRFNPNFAGAYNNLGNALKDTGQMREAIECYRKSIAIDPKSDVAGNLLYSIHFDPQYDARKIAQECAEWNRLYAKPLAATVQPHSNERSPDRALRIGYVGLDLREHPVGRFLLPLLQNHDRSAFEIICYSDLTRPDAVTEKFRACANSWHSTPGISDEALASMIRQDRIDILVDLAMHMDGTRMLTFARKPAPVQVTYLAYCSTTGLETMDYRLTDPYLDPPGIDESIYSEKSVRLQRTYWCYQPPAIAPELAPLPSKSRGYITFGCLNNFAKVSPAALAVWMQILRNVPDSRLVFHCGEGSHRQRLLDQFTAQGIAPDRITFIGRIGLAEYFQQYQQIDVALDPFPYPGGTTTCDALWMGVPVVTLAGPTAYSRGGVSILSNIGLTEIIADNTERYIASAVELAQDQRRLKEMRTTLRQRMMDSPLMNAPTFARDVEAAFRMMWRECCQGAED